MKLTAIAAAIAVVAVPMTVQGAQAPAKSNPPAKRICTVDTTIGTRLGNTRRCRTRSEDDAAKQEARQVVDRIQTLKATCRGSGLCG